MAGTPTLVVAARMLHFDAKWSMSVLFCARLLEARRFTASGRQSRPRLSRVSCLCPQRVRRSAVRHLPGTCQQHRPGHCRSGQPTVRPAITLRYIVQVWPARAICEPMEINLTDVRNQQLIFVLLGHKIGCETLINHYLLWRFSQGKTASICHRQPTIYQNTLSNVSQ